MEDVVLVHIPNRVGQAGEGVVIPVCAAHATTHKQIIALQLASLIADDHHTDVVGEYVNAVVTRDSDSNLELTRQELCTIQGFGAVLKVGAKRVESAICCDLGVLQAEYQVGLTHLHHGTVCSTRQQRRWQYYPGLAGNLRPYVNSTGAGMPTIYTTLQQTCGALFATCTQILQHATGANMPSEDNIDFCRNGRGYTTPAASKK